MELYLISDNVDTLTGLRMVGIPGAVVHTAEEFDRALAKVLQNANIGILLVIERLAKLYPEKVREIKLTRSLPLIVEIPDRHGTGRAADFITAYVRDAIGVKL